MRHRAVCSSIPLAWLASLLPSLFRRSVQWPSPLPSRAARATSPRRLTTRARAEVQEMSTGRSPRPTTEGTRRSARLAHRPTAIVRWGRRRTCRPTRRGSWLSRPRARIPTCSFSICRASSPGTPRSQRRRSSCRSPTRRRTGRVSRSWASGTRPAGATRGSLRSPDRSPGSSCSTTRSLRSTTRSYTSKEYASWRAARGQRAPTRSSCRRGHPRQRTPRRVVRSPIAWATARELRSYPQGTHGRPPSSRRRTAARSRTPARSRMIR
jgi:hypothetical protein